MDQIVRFDRGEQPAERSTKPGVLSALNEKVKKAADTGYEFFKGVGKGVGSTIYGAAKLGQAIANPIERVFGAKQTDIGPKPAVLQPTNPAQKVGQTAEQIGEFFVPLGGQAKTGALASRFIPKAESIIGRASAAIGKLVARGAGEGGEYAAKTALHGSEPDDIVQAFLLGAIVPAAGELLTTGKKVVSAALPERLYKQVFRVAEDDLRLQIQSQARGRELNPTLAKEVLDRGLFGSSNKMAVYSVKKLDQLEADVQTLVSRDKVIKLPRKNDFVALLKSVEEQFGKGFFSDRAKEAGKLGKLFEKENPGFVRQEDALAARRFLDRMRNTSSFRLDPNLSGKQEELKIAADTIRKTLAQDDKFAGLMNEERVFVQALDSLIEDAVKRQNRRLLNLTDIILGGGGLATGGPFGAAVGIGAIRGFQQPGFLTTAAQFLKRAGEAVPAAAPEVTARSVGALFAPKTKE